MNQRKDILERVKHIMKEQPELKVNCSKLARPLDCCASICVFHSRRRISPFTVTIVDAVIDSIYVPPMLKIRLTLYTDFESLCWYMVLVRLYYTRYTIGAGYGEMRII